MRCKFMIAAALWIGIPHVALADEGRWSWMFISPRHNSHTKSDWYTDQGTANDNSAGSKFDILLGGGATAAEPDHLDHYGLKGTIRGNSVTATLNGIDTDEAPTRFSGNLAIKDGMEHISLVSSDGTTILLYRPAKTPN